MKAGWKNLKLGEVCTFENGDRGENYPSRSAFVLEGIPIINAGHLSEVGIDASEMNFITRDRFDLLRSGKIRLGDVLFCLRGSLGKFAVNDVYEEGAIASSLIIIRPTEKLDTGFLAAYLQSALCEEQIRKYENGAAQPNLGGKSLEQFIIPIPPLEEQLRIVAVLDTALAGIATATANAKKNLTNARTLFDSYVQSAFSNRSAGWTTYRFDQICENLDGRRRPVTKNIRTAGDIPYYGASGQVDSVADFLFDEDLLLVSEDGANLLMRTYPIAFSISGKSWVNNHAHVLRFPDRPTQSIVEYYLNSISLAPYVSGMAQPKLNQKSLNGIPIPLPLENQRADMVATLDKLSSKCEELSGKYQLKLAAYTELKQSLLQKAFAGELT